jgi:GH24 family phage-related lysozyme (muramidase)
MWLDIFVDGRVYEMEGAKAIRLFNTGNEILKLIDVLQKTQAGQFSIAPPDKVAPEFHQPTSVVPQCGIDLIKESEGYHEKLNDGTDRVRAYPDPALKWEVPTIGYGTTKYSNGQVVKQGDIITRQEAEAHFVWEVEQKCRIALEKIPTWEQMNENQRGALYSFAYNLGANFYRRSGFDSITMVCNSPDRWSDSAWIAEQFGKYITSNRQVLAGLVTRRKEEAKLFCKPVQG